MVEYFPMFQFYLFSDCIVAEVIYLFLKIKNHFWIVVHFSYFPEDNKLRKFVGTETPYYYFFQTIWAIDPCFKMFWDSKLKMWAEDPLCT